MIFGIPSTFILTFIVFVSGLFCAVLAHTFGWQRATWIAWGFSLAGFSQLTLLILGFLAEHFRTGSRKMPQHTNILSLKAILYASRAAKQIQEPDIVPFNAVLSWLNEEELAFNRFSKILKDTSDEDDISLIIEFSPRCAKRETIFRVLLIFVYLTHRINENTDRRVRFIAEKLDIFGSLFDELVRDAKYTAKQIDKRSQIVGFL